MRLTVRKRKILSLEPSSNCLQSLESSDTVHILRYFKPKIISHIFGTIFVKLTQCKNFDLTAPRFWGYRTLATMTYTVLFVALVMI